ncbi:hypothetical protein [Sorangium sp. So ce1099]
MSTRDPAAPPGRALLPWKQPVMIGCSVASRATPLRPAPADQAK